MPPPVGNLRLLNRPFGVEEDVDGDVQHLVAVGTVTDPDLRH
jgi:hypothetical protein